MAETNEAKRDKLVKNLKVSLRTHKEIAHASTDTGKAMYELIDEAWECWKRAAGTPASGGSTTVPPVDELLYREQNKRVETSKHLEEAIARFIKETQSYIPGKAGELPETKTNPGIRGRGHSPGPRKRRNG